MRVETESAAPASRTQSRRSFWVRQTLLWHWMSSAICLCAMLLFTITGITLNHASEIPSIPKISKKAAQLPPDLLRLLRQSTFTGKHPLPAALAQWLSTQFPEKRLDEEAEWSDTEIYLSLPRPGGDGWLTIDRESGEVTWEKTDRGWISYFNDLHKGRHTGFVWKVFIDVIAVAFLVFTATGVVLLQIHATRRPLTWPAVAFGFAGVIVLLLFFMHR